MLKCKEAMTTALIYLDNRLPARHQILRAHHDRVIKQAVCCATDKQGLRQPSAELLKIFIEGRYGRALALLGSFARQKGADKSVYAFQVQDEFGGEVEYLWEVGEVVGAEGEDLCRRGNSRVGAKDME